MAVISDFPQTWPDACVDIWPIELSTGYWAVVGLIPYDGHVVLAVSPNRPRPAPGDPRISQPETPCD